MAAINRVARAALALCLVCGPAFSTAEVLPEDRADLLYHVYDGGGVTVEGPSVLVRKSFKDAVSVYGNYYVDMVSSASIDVLASGASKYSEERTEYSAGVDVLVDNAILSASLTDSSENDYDATTFSLGASQTFFGDLTTLSLGYARGDDTVRRNSPPDQSESANAFEDYIDRRRFSLGLSQILTRSWVMALNVETVTDDGYLNNPYRQARYRDEITNDVKWQSEVYPRSRNSDAIALRSMYYLPYRASVRAEARVFTDSWGIKARNFELRYIHPLTERMIFELKGRTYTQTQADFYSDLFEYLDPLGTEYRARDKELSSYNSFNLGFGLTYELGYNLPRVQKQTLGFYWDFMHFDYDNYRNAALSVGGNSELEAPPAYVAGEEPTYSFQANVLRIFVSFYY